MKRLEKSNGDIDFSTWFDKPKYLREVRKLNTSDIKVLIRDLKSFTKKGGEKIIKYNNQYVPQAYKETYQRSIRRYNRNKKRLEQYNLNKMKKPDSDFMSFLEFSRKAIQKANPIYWNKRKWQYKENYKSAVKNSLAFTQKGKELLKLIDSIDAEKLINIYYTKGNEDLGINNIYPGQRDEAEATAEYLIDRWNQVI